MNDVQAQNALVEGLRVRGTDQYGHVYEGTLDAMYVWVPGEGQVHPVNAPGHQGPILYVLAFHIERGLYSTVEGLTADRIELV